jgi:hypothetical protein
MRAEVEGAAPMRGVCGAASNSKQPLHGACCVHATRHPKADIEVDANAASSLEDAKVNAE